MPAARAELRLLFAALLLTSSAWQSCFAEDGAEPQEECPVAAAAASGGLLELPGSEGFFSTAILLVLVLGAFLQLGCCLCFFVEGVPAARLVLWGCMTEAWALRSVSSTCALLRLKRAPTPMLQISGRVTDAGAAALGTAVRAHGKTAQTQAIALPGNPALTCRGVAALCKEVLSPACTLKAMDLSHNKQLGSSLSGILVPHLAGNAGSPSCLRSLLLADCGLTKESVVELSKVVGASVLRTLDLSQNAISGAGAALAAIAEAPLLEDLRLVDCGLGDADVVDLAPALPASGLLSLDLAFNTVGSEGVLALARHVGGAPLQSLSLVQNQIDSGEPLGQLAGAWAAQPRNHLDIVGNMLSKEKIQAFSKVLASLG